MNEPKKICTHCQAEKPLDEFTNNARRLDGKGEYCLICNREISLKYSKGRSTRTVVPYNRIKLLLELTGVKQVELQNELGISRTTAHGYVSNLVQPPMKTLFKIARIFNIAPSELINNQAEEK